MITLLVDTIVTCLCTFLEALEVLWKHVMILLGIFHAENMSHQGTLHLLVFATQ